MLRTDAGVAVMPRDWETELPYLKDLFTETKCETAAGESDCAAHIKASAAKTGIGSATALTKVNHLEVFILGIRASFTDLSDDPEAQGIRTRSKAFGRGSRLVSAIRAVRAIEAAGLRNPARFLKSELRLIEEPKGPLWTDLDFVFEGVPPGNYNPREQVRKAILKAVISGMAEIVKSGSKPKLHPEDLASPGELVLVHAPNIISGIGKKAEMKKLVPRPPKHHNLLTRDEFDAVRHQYRDYASLGGVQEQLVKFCEEPNVGNANSVTEEAKETYKCRASFDKLMRNIINARRDALGPDADRTERRGKGKGKGKGKFAALEEVPPALRAGSWERIESAIKSVATAMNFEEGDRNALLDAFRPGTQVGGCGGGKGA